MATVFKDYDGNPIKVPTHDHVIADTQKDGATAYATTTQKGFARKEDINKLNYLKDQADYIEEKMKDMAFTTAENAEV